MPKDDTPRSAPTAPPTPAPPQHGPLPKRDQPAKGPVAPGKKPKGK